MNIGYDAKRIFHNTTGLGNYSRDLVRIMANYYPQHQYFLYNPKPPKVQRLQLTENMHVKQPVDFFSRLLPAVWRSKLIINDLLDDKIDIYHGLSAELPTGIEKTGIKSVVTIHDLIFVRYPRLYKAIDRKIYLKKFLKAVHAADKVVAISHQTQKDIEELAPAVAGKIEVIYQGCHQAFKKDYSDDFKQKVLQKYNLPENFLLNVGTIEPRKNVFSIVKAIEPTAYHLVLVGRPTPYAEKIKKFVAENNMQNRVHFLQALSLDELAVLYRKAKIFIYPSLYEGFGIPIIEALYSRTPVITNRHGVFSEAAGPHSFYLDDVEKPVEMRKLIEKVLRENVSEQVGQSYEFVQKFNDDKIASQWTALYQNLLSSET